MKKRITIEDVAKAAGVSRQTVSRAINDKGEISAATKDRVMKAVQQLGYRPSRLAQGMVTQRTRTIGLLIGDITNPYFAEVARSVQDIAQKKDYNVFLSNSDDLLELEMKNMHSLASQGVDGIISLSNSMAEKELFAFSEQYDGIPVVMINRPIDHPHISNVLTDNFHGAQLVTEYLVGKGHQHIGMIANVREPIDKIKRVLGFQAVMAQHNLSSDALMLDLPTMEGGHAVTKKLLAEYPQLTAVIAYNDLMALGTIRACHDMGKRVPDDVAVIGFDNIHSGKMSVPALSTVDIDTYSIGREAICRLLEMLDNPDNSFPPIHLDVSLVLRESA